MALAIPDTVVLELMTMGQQSAAHLRDLLRSVSPHQELAAEILSCCGRVIAALTANETAGGQKRKAVQHEYVATPSARSPPRKRARCGADDALGVVRSGTTADGFIWRKYGQKEISGRKHPRLYYRCAYRHQGCAATRRVQRAHDEDEEPPAYEIAYYGEHTCRGAATTCHGAALPLTIVDFGSNAWGGCDSTAPAASSSEQLWFSWDGGEMSSTQGGLSASSEVGFEAQMARDDTAPAEVRSATPCDASDPLTEFLDGCFDWDSVINDVPFDFGALLPSHCNASVA